MILNFNVKGKITLDLDEEIVKYMIEEKVDVNNLGEVEKWLTDYCVGFDTHNIFETFDTTLESLELEDGEKELFEI